MWGRALGIFLTAELLIAAQPISTEAHRFIEMRNGIYLAEPIAPVFISNSLVIVNDGDVVLVDSQGTRRPRQLCMSMLMAQPGAGVLGAGNQEHRRGLELERSCCFSKRESGF